jgi:hypothetical protein
MHAVNTTVEVERLYDELRECIRSNDQDGVQRIMGELVRAKRPLAEIIGEVKRLTRGGARSEPGLEPSITDDWPQPSTTPPSVEPAPKVAPEPTYTHFTSTNTPAAGPLSEAGNPAYREPERDAAVLRQWPPADVWPDPKPSRAEPTSQSFDGSAAFDLRRYPEIAAPPAISETEPAENSSAQEWAKPNPLPAVEQSTPKPPDQHVAPAIEPEAASPDVAPAITEGEGVSAASDPELQRVPTEFEQGTLDIGPQISGRAIALGVGLEGGEEADSTQHAQRSRPWGARLIAALVVFLVLLGGGVFLLVKPAGDTVADKPNPSAVAVAPPAVQPVVTEGSAPAAAGPGASGSPSGLAPTALLPAPVAPSPQAATAAPDSPAPAKPDSKPSVANLDPPNGAPSKSSATPDRPASVTAPAASPVPVVPTEPPPPAQPRPSLEETASLLERGDRLFGMGDVISARLFYERAAEAGDGPAALRLGETYDPTFLERAKLRAIKGDLKAAAFWYRRAKELGVVEADILLKGLQTK